MRHYGFGTRSASHYPVGVMPTYLYKFVETGVTIEVQQAFSDDALTQAIDPADGVVRAVKKVFTPVGVTFKGGGFYKNDARGSSSTTSTSSSSDSSSSPTSPATPTSNDSSSSSSTSSTPTPAPSAPAPAASTKASSD